MNDPRSDNNSDAGGAGTSGQNEPSSSNNTDEMHTGSSENGILIFWIIKISFFLLILFILFLFFERKTI